jgi:hypothetical protein
MRKIIFAVLLVIALAAKSSSIRLISAQTSTLIGPILVGQTVNPETYEDAGVVFHDVGAGRTWEVAASKGIYPHTNWAPDGCNILLFYEGLSSLSMTDLSAESLPHLGNPIWNLNGKGLYFFKYDSELKTTNVYTTNERGKNPKLTYSIGEWMGNTTWLSKNELIYNNGTDWFIWNANTSDIHPFYAKNEKIPVTIEHRDFYNTDNISPNFEMQIGYYDLLSWRGAFNDNTEEGIAELKTLEPTLPGFDIYFLKWGKQQHIDVKGQFVDAITWSPSSSKIAITTDYGGTDYGVYVYNITAGTLQRLGDAFNDQPSATYSHSWSPDEVWLAFYTAEGYVIQRLADGKRIQIDKRIKFHPVYWSPVMDYRAHPCK